MIRQLFDRVSCTYTYIVLDLKTRECVVIDPVMEQFDRDETLMKQWGYTPKYTLETHTHADHISAAKLFREKYKSKIAVSSYGLAKGADIYLKENDSISTEQISIKVLHTPGHTEESLCFLYKETIFTGDTLLIRGCGRTDFQGGSADDLYESVHSKIFTLPSETKIFPGHDYQGRLWSSVGEEKKHNPRLTQTKEQFKELMQNLGLSYPEKMNVAVPANSLFPDT